MPRVLARLTTAVASAALLFAALPATALPATALPADAHGRLPAVGSRAAADPSTVLGNLSACLAERKAGDLVLLIDTSGSLGGEGGTDTTGVRVDAAQSLLTRLAATFTTSGAAVDVAVAGFDDDVTSVVDFTPLTEANLPTLDAAVEGFTLLDRGSETDYWSALTWLNRTFQARSTPDAVSDCRFAVWFSDGMFTISARDGSDLGRLDPPTGQTKDVPGFENVPLTSESVADEVRAVATAELCRPGGVADQMRLDGITMIAVGLGGDASQFDFMKRYAENPTGDCGEQPAAGLFVPAGSVGALFLTLDRLGQLGGGTGPLEPRQVCELTTCAEGRYPFALDNTLGTVHLAAVVSDEVGSLLASSDLQVELVPPDGGDPLVISGQGGAGTGTAAGAVATATYRWFQGGGLTIDLDRNVDQSWAGEWSLTFIDTTGTHPDAVSQVQITLASDFQIVPTVESAKTPWQAGVDGSVEFLPQRLDGSSAPLDALPAGLTTEATLTLPGSDGEVVPIEVGFDGPVSVPLPRDVPIGTATVQVSLVITLAGEQLAPVVRQASVEIIPPFGSPVIPASQLVDFGAIEGLAQAAGTLTVTGADNGDGCVRVGATDLQVNPPSVDTATITGADPTCIVVPAGRTVQVPVTLALGAEGNGALQGTVDVEVSPADDPSVVSTSTVAFRAELTRTPQAAVKTAVLIGVLLLGLLIPLLIALLGRRATARFPTGQDVALSAVPIDVRIGPRGLTTPDGRALAVPADGWQPVPPPGAGRRTLLVGGLVLRARAGWKLTEPGHAQLDGPEVIGTGSLAPHHDPAGRPRMPLAVQGTWLVTVPRTLGASPLPDVPARLLLVVDTAADEPARATLLADAVRDAPGLLQDARTAASAGSAPDPGAGGPPSDTSSGAPAGTRPSDGWSGRGTNGWGGASSTPSGQPADPGVWPGSGSGSAPSGWPSAPGSVGGLRPGATQPGWGPPPRQDGWS
ncbi:VWA domain-containing protein [Nakamurella flavida]|uniref:VWA domain-containing protein n=1 Tax=Nakamurella flavida TaxID=363630 RepID=A0A938YKR5_9ACTN|nr:VWA domain-containing protein [Nakamurella flavida]MBM9476493.1 VWA domain-containing protein [Nakamurella flavida]MDP9779071.1 hypothetical protein [Nakamurella flavida]